MDEINKILQHEYYNEHWEKQNDTYDKLTSFIYRVKNFSEITTKMDEIVRGIWNYALHRRLNLLPHDKCIDIFIECGAIPCKMYDKEKDFELYGITYDLKVSTFPKGYHKTFVPYSRRSRDDVIRWLYQNQSSNGRMHFANRLFIVVEGEQKNKTKIDIIGNHIKRFMEYYKNRPMNELEVEYNGTTYKVYSDLIYISKNELEGYSRG